MSPNKPRYFSDISISRFVLLESKSRIITSGVLHHGPRVTGCAHNSCLVSRVSLAVGTRDVMTPHGFCKLGYGSARARHQMVPISQSLDPRRFDCHCKVHCVFSIVFCPNDHHKKPKDETTKNQTNNCLHFDGPPTTVKTALNSIPPDRRVICGSRTLLQN